MCISKLFKRNAALEKPSAPKGGTDKSVPVNKSANTFTEMRHQAGTVDQKLKGKHHTGSF